MELGTGGPESPRMTAGTLAALVVIAALPVVAVAGGLVFLAWRRLSASREGTVALLDAE